MTDDAAGRAVRILSDCPGFKDLDEALLKQVAGLAHFFEVPAGGTVVEQGEKGDAFYVIVDGSAKVEVEMGGDTMRAGEVGRGSFFGEVGVLYDKERTASVTAVSPLQLLVVPGGALREVIEASPKLRDELAAVGDQRIEENLDHYLGGLADEFADV